MEEYYNEKNWVYTGLAYGLIMLVIMGLYFHLYQRVPFTIKTLLFEIVVWTVGGLIFGYSMKLYFDRRRKRAK